MAATTTPALRSTAITSNLQHLTNAMLQAEAHHQAAAALEALVEGATTPVARETFQLEAHRQREAAAEMEDDADHRRDVLIGLGYVPE